MKRVELKAIPGLGGLYLKAAGARGGGTALPDKELAVSGVTIDPEHLRDYADLCGFTGGAALPLTYPHVLGFPLQVALMTDPSFPAPMLGIVHVVNEITVHRELTAADELDFVVRAENLRPHRRGRQFDLVTEVSTGGELAWRGVSTYLARGKGADEGAAEEIPVPDVARVATLSAGPSWRFAADAGRRYAAVAGDVNPIHMSGLTAKALGFPRAIAHGMFTYAKVIAALGPRVPVTEGTSTVWFHKPVLLPSRTLLRSEIEPGHTVSVLLPAKGSGDHLVVENRW